MDYCNARSPKWRSAINVTTTKIRVDQSRGHLGYSCGSLRRARAFAWFSPRGNPGAEAARIESLCGSLEQSVIVSWAFADAAGEARSLLVSLGRYAMKGIARPQELFTLDLG